MEKRLPVESAADPYRYVCENMEAVKARLHERLREGARRGSGVSSKRFSVLRMLGTFETLQALKEGFERNGWGEPGCGVPPQKQGLIHGTKTYHLGEKTNPIGLFDPIR